MISVASEGSFAGKCFGWTGAGGAVLSSALTSSDNIYTFGDGYGWVQSLDPLSEPYAPSSCHNSLHPYSVLYTSSPSLLHARSSLPVAT